MYVGVFDFFLANVFRKIRSEICTWNCHESVNNFLPGLTVLLFVGFSFIVCVCLDGTCFFYFLIHFDMSTRQSASANDVFFSDKLST